MKTKLKQEQQNTKQSIGKLIGFYVRGTRKEEEVPSRSSSCDFSRCRTLRVVMCVCVVGWLRGTEGEGVPTVERHFCGKKSSRGRSEERLDHKRYLSSVLCSLLVLFT
jgi:hypothetical protein